MAGPPTIALYWCAGCGGCEESVFDMAEQLLDVYEKTRIVFWPAALDARSSDVEALADGEIDAAFINGAIRLDEHVQMVAPVAQKIQMPDRPRYLRPHGRRNRVGQFLFIQATAGLCLSARPQHGYPKGSPAPARAPTPAPPDIPCPDCYQRFCPWIGSWTWRPSSRGVRHHPKPWPRSLTRSSPAFCRPKARSTRIKRRCAIAAPDGIPGRNESRSADSKGLQDTLWDPTVCFLAQDLICLGPVTRGGCNARCISANMPCRGCFGPTTAMDDFGAGAMALIAALMADGDETDYEALIESIPDPGGLFYRYSLAASILGKGRRP